MDESKAQWRSQVPQVTQPAAELSHEADLNENASEDPHISQMTGAADAKPLNAVLENPRWVEWTERLILLAEWMEHNEEKTNYYKPLQ